jgi:ribosomal protein L12E/L44/L45/RPP1/RPP2
MRLLEISVVQVVKVVQVPRSSGTGSETFSQTADDENREKIEENEEESEEEDEDYEESEDDGGFENG